MSPRWHPNLSTYIYGYIRLGSTYDGTRTKAEAAETLLKSFLAYAGTVSDLGRKMADDMTYLLDTISSTECPSTAMKRREEKRLEGVRKMYEKLIRDCDVTRDSFCNVKDRLAQVRSAASSCT